jgi:hypothetical protein
MTIDQLTALLAEQRKTLGGDAPVAILWDSALTDFKHYGTQNGALIFDADWWCSSELNVKFDLCAFRTENER